MGDYDRRDDDDCRRLKRRRCEPVFILCRPDRDRDRYRDRDRGCDRR